LTSISASSWARSAIRSPRRRSSAPRWLALSRRQSPEVKALRAAATALSASVAPPRGIRAQTWPVNGL
jgi:hypothetical protein